MLDEELGSGRLPYAQRLITEGLTFDLAFREWSAIIEPLEKFVGADDILLTRRQNPLVKDIPFSDFNINSITLTTKGFYSDSYWPRDFSASINGFTFLNPDAFDVMHTPNSVVFSSFGEGGGVIAARNAVLVNPFVWQNKRHDAGFNLLRNNGYVIAPLPLVEDKGQKHPYVDTHIDGHASLIIDKQGGLRLFVARTYAYQGGKTLGNIQRAADTVGARVTIVGLPLITKGSVRCMTNIIPQTLLQQLVA